ncbi:MAG: hypothetical protein MZV64_59085 [Ignavibacteriales bacterium]|nr:hypothetical protein [Ignavibacteriales bacterium]
MVRRIRVRVACLSSGMSRSVSNRIDLPSKRIALDGDVHQTQAGAGRASTSFERKIAPAQVPQIAWRLAKLRAAAPSSSYATASFPIVVDSPPGMISPSSPSRCSGRRTSTRFHTQAACSMAICSAKSPCRARHRFS